MKRKKDFLWSQHCHSSLFTTKNFQPSRLSPDVISQQLTKSKENSRGKKVSWNIFRKCVCCIVNRAWKVRFLKHKNTFGTNYCFKILVTVNFVRRHFLLKQQQGVSNFIIRISNFKLFAKHPEMFFIFCKMLFLI